MEEPACIMLLTMAILIASKLFFLLPIPPLLQFLGKVLFFPFLPCFSLSIINHLIYIVWYGLESRGFSRFVNIRDGKGATPLHLAARQRRSDCVHILLSRGALVCASTSGYW